MRTERDITDAPNAGADHMLAFGNFRLLPTARVLYEGERQLHLGSRAMDILITLAASAGEVWNKFDLIAKIWPGFVVEESNLRVHIAALRKALRDGQGGNRFIENIAGRGYCFVAPVDRSAAAPAIVLPPPIRHNLPTSMSRIMGRDDAIAALAALLPARRFVTIVGAGGMGKTTLALAVAEELLQASGVPGWLVELAPLSDARLVAPTVAQVLGLPAHSGDVLPELLEFLRPRQMLIILDSCERLVEAAAVLAEAIYAAAPGVHILITSREPLRAHGEWVHRLTPMEMPPRAAQLTAAQAACYPAVELFCERATACSDSFVLADADVANVVELCHRLDGMPLAIELAAARVELFGLSGLVSRLDDRFNLLTRGRRTALERHRTLQATLDWSYEYLPAQEQLVLMRLALFPSGFTFEAAVAVAADGALEAHAVIDGVDNLVAKSMITVQAGSEMVLYRLLDTTRVYARARLLASHGTAQVARRHAGYCLDALRQAARDWEHAPIGAWLARYGWIVDDLRAALAWALSPGGDVMLGNALRQASSGLRYQLSLLDMQRSHASAVEEMQLGAMLGHLTPPPALPCEEGLPRLAVHDLAQRPDAIERRVQCTVGGWSGALITDAARHMWRWPVAMHN